MKTLILTESQQKFIRENIKQLTYVELGTAVGMTKAQVVDQIRVMGLSKFSFADIDHVPELGEWFDWNTFILTDPNYFNSPNKII